MDAALLLVAGNETCPQPQTSEHLAAVEIMRLQNIIILQNKVTVGEDGCCEPRIGVDCCVCFVSCVFVSKDVLGKMMVEPWYVALLEVFSD